MRRILFLAIFAFFINYGYGQTKHTVQVSNFQFTPSSLTIALGDTVTWQWIQGTHTTTSDSTTGPNSWNSPISSSSPTFSFVLSSQGLHRYYCIPHGGPGGQGMSGTIQVESAVAVNEDLSNITYDLMQNYPNPFNPSTSITLSIPVSGTVSIRVYDLLGQQVIELFTGHLERGLHKFNYNSQANQSGIYFYKAEVKGEDGSEYTSIKKMTLLK